MDILRIAETKVAQINYSAGTNYVATADKCSNGHPTVHISIPEQFGVVIISHKDEKWVQEDVLRVIELMDAEALKGLEEKGLFSSPYTSFVTLVRGKTPNEDRVEVESSMSCWTPIFLLILLPFWVIKKAIFG